MSFIALYGDLQTVLPGGEGMKSPEGPYKMTGTFESRRKRNGLQRPVQIGQQYFYVIHPDFEQVYVQGMPRFSPDTLLQLDLAKVHFQREMIRGYGPVIVLLYIQQALLYALEVSSA